jgi:hypothetical protein
MIFTKDYAESILQGIEHDSSFLTPNKNAIADEALNHLKNGTGVRKACLWTLMVRIQAKSMLDYFQSSNLYSIKQGAYAAAKLEIMQIHAEPGGNLESLAWALLSDNPEIIAWWKQHRLYGERPRKPEDADNFKTDVYLRRQTLRALNGEWDTLGPACELALASPDVFNKIKGRINQFRFYLELAKGNITGMHDVLMEMCDVKARRRNFFYESGLTAYFVVMIATLFAKIAWRHGYELELDTPWIPKDWLPIQPNDHYEDPWPFMKDFDIWQPFPEPYAAYSPRRP